MLFENATILTMNTRREIITHGAVATTGKIIAAVGKSKEIIEQFPDKRRINCNGNILLPGLIDTHVHLAQCMLRGATDGGGVDELLEWLTRYIWPLQGSYTEEDGLASASLCVLEMLKSGTTGFIEVLLAEVYGIDGIAAMCEKAGIRAALGKVAMDMTPKNRAMIQMHPGMWEEHETCISNTLKAHDRWNGAGDGRIQIWFGARTPGEAINSGLYDEIGKLANQRNMGITVHCSELPEHISYARSQGHHSPTDFLNAHGALGSRTVLSHYILSDKEDWELVTAAGASVSHNPFSNAKAGWGIARVAEMRAAGVNISIGCDAGAANNSMDMIKEMRAAAYISRQREGNQDILPGEVALEMATLGGAQAMGIQDQVGSIEVGKHADFILIDTDKPHLTPVWNPVATVVYSANGGDVDTVVIDGKIIMQNRQVLTLDEEAILEHVNKRFKDVASRAGAEVTPIWPVI
jgi:cytosine/adenosine deaminase-related metal-dependent hydrolase